MPAQFTAVGEPKPETSLIELMRENYEVEKKRFAADLRRQHHLLGCPLGRGYVVCLVCNGDL